jgi:hypothetical protein
MFTKTKITIGILILVAFIAGGFALNAIKSNAFWGFKGNGDMSGEELRAQCEEEGDCPHPHELRMGFGPFKMFNEEVDHQIVELENGVQITITSDNADVVQKLHDWAEKINSLE